jgi:hypothetical protein
MRRATAVFVVMTLALTGCASPDRRADGGGDSIHFGPPLTLHLCVLKSVSLSAHRANAYIADVRSELEPYRITLEVSWVHPWEQPGDRSTAILADLTQRPLEAPCDRLLALVDRTGTAFVSGLLLPELSGEVDRSTATHGYVVLAYTTPNPLFRRAEDASIAEFHELLGCTPAMSPTACDHRIAEVKAGADPEAGFFPGITPDGAYLTTRAAVNEALLGSSAPHR